MQLDQETMYGLVKKRGTFIQSITSSIQVKEKRETYKTPLKIWFDILCVISALLSILILSFQVLFVKKT